MKPAISICALAAFAAPFSLGCSKDKKDEPDNLQTAVITQPGSAANPAAAHPTPASAKSGMTGQGTVSETMNAGGYTYVKVDGVAGPVWAAAPETSVKVGDSVSFAGGMPMEQFRSNTLDRTFDLVYFVPALTINGAGAPAAAHGVATDAMPASSGTPAVAQAEIKGIERAKGGKTIAEIFAGKAELGGKSVSVRGKVVKYNGGIMGRNWVHIQDGSGAAGTNDLTVTTNTEVAVGDTVLVTGGVSLDKNFGGGYKYDLIIEDATIVVE